MKSGICLVLVALFAASQAMTVWRMEVEENDVKCPNGSACQDGETCCDNQAGGYSCCPLPKAVCCGDKLHCCPEGYTCDVAAGKCLQGDNVLTWFTKMTYKPAPNDVKCPDGSTCQDGQTCCENFIGGYSCCPSPKAVCCDDKRHCCPNGFTCDVAAQKCQKGDDVLSWFTKLAAKPAPNDVKCPDGSECQDGQTCCANQAGGYSCCPQANAVCCNDKLHCCPEGYTCDVAAGKCLKGDDVLSWFTKLAAKYAPNEVKCPDGSACRDGQTCCELLGGGYGCCPEPKAVCCDDKIHCCPNGFTCDSTGEKCLDGDNAMTWLTKVSAKPAPNDVKCPDGSACQDGQTCCANQAGRYSCCPLPKAVCCDDKLHCCPNGFTCDSTGEKCVQGDNAMTWLTKVAAKPPPNDVKCIDGSTCQDGQTCCANQAGGYSCCPLPKAVCCDDKLHCCPEGYTCDVAAGKCLKGDDVLSWFRKLAAKSATNEVKCPDGSACQDGQTCCENQAGGYSCCPAPKAVCCDDKIHCCPNGYTCDSTGEKCLDGDNAMTWLTKVVAKPAPNEVKCPDGSACRDGQTCCEMLGGGYGCCPEPKAVCCDDKIHCCPHGYTCDSTGEKCLQGDNIMTWLTKVAAKPAPNDVKCPDGSACQDRQTCCANKAGGYSCCPLPKAVCCDDKLHCCPEGYTCDAAAGKCLKGDDVLSWFTKLTAKSAPNEVKCPDGSACQDGQTCCENQAGGYSCCPAPKAVCCDDKIHCCPNGYTCDSTGEKCLDGDNAMTWLTKVATKSAPNEVKCPDGGRCPDGHTCCEMPGGGYGCCPYLKAVCCDDKIHCCPNGYTCDSTGQKCLQGDNAMTWLTKVAAKPAPNDVKCPDGSACQDRQTCCANKAGGYSCCPLPKAVCCDDKLHCCPEGYTCDAAAGKCLKGDDVLSWFTKLTAKSAPNEVKCPDGSACQDGQTCCENQAGGYSCCPAPKAVCCDDKIHCCPNGYTCDSTGEKCLDGDNAMTWLTKVATKSAPNEVKCPDGGRCPDGHTCCEMRGGGYGCCPYLKAVCCDDKLHCCPEGYTCDAAAGKCLKGDDVLSWFTKLTAKSAPNEVKCPDGSACQDGQTCCENQAGGYSCCPAPKAVCCDDKIHCCPNGYTCDSTGEKCLDGDNAMTWLTKVATKSAPNEVKCPDGGRCPDGHTCCEMRGGGYGCCPYLKAVCCDDKLHCCPEGYTCDAAAGKCLKGDDVLSWFTKLTAKSAPNEVKCPDGSACQDGQTCCENQAGGYSCCPAPKAVCCDDKIHCCPNGYTCDSTGEKCLDGDNAMTWLTKVATKSAPNEVKCPDGGRCPDGHTCCEMRGGGYGCCPYLKAVCCDDKLHCCPEGYTCDAAAGKCLKGDDVLSWFTKLTAKSAPNEVKCPDGSACQDGQTCCENQAGGYSCCPAPKAVCCDDKIHCCPNGYTCDSTGEKCLDGDNAMTWLTKVATKSAPNEVKCPDRGRCPDGHTCCEMPGGGYGCCPYLKAVCCDDKIHCCPNGYTCDSTGQKCLQGDNAMTWLTKVAAKPAPNDVKCPDGSACQDGQTCCENQAGGYSCCPVPKAVCCEDKLHCCPEGYTCDVAAGKCLKGGDVLAWFTKAPSRSTP